MRLVEVRVTQAHRGLKVGEIVRAAPHAADALVSQGRAELVGGSPAPLVAPLEEAVAKPPRKRAPKKAVEAEDTMDDAEPKPKRTRKGKYSRRDMRAQE